MENALSVLDIGFRVGFGNYSNFNRQFKKIKGYNPKALRQQFLYAGPEARFDAPMKLEQMNYTNLSISAKTLGTRSA
jgi:AraC-like DNA-binding protein